VGGDAEAEGASATWVGIRAGDSSLPAGVSGRAAGAEGAAGEAQPTPISTAAARAASPRTLSLQFIYYTSSAIESRIQRVHCTCG
jgi:hypothetical protein